VWTILCLKGVVFPYCKGTLFHSLIIEGEGYAVLLQIAYFLSYSMLESVKESYFMLGDWPQHSNCQRFSLLVFINLDFIIMHALQILKYDYTWMSLRFWSMPKQISNKICHSKSYSTKYTHALTEKNIFSMSLHLEYRQYARNFLNQNKMHLSCSTILNHLSWRREPTTWRTGIPSPVQWLNSRYEFQTEESLLPFSDFIQYLLK